MPKFPEDPTTPKGRVMADGEGRFFFTDLHPGEYWLNASKDGYSPGIYGQRRAQGQGQLLSLAEGERLTDVTLRMWKHGVIAGTVIDEAGEPVVGVAVRALVKDFVAGRPRYGTLQTYSSRSRRPTIAACSGCRSWCPAPTWSSCRPRRRPCRPRSWRRRTRRCGAISFSRASPKWRSSGNLDAAGGRLRPHDVESRAGSSAPVDGRPHDRY